MSYLGRKYGDEKQQEFAKADILTLPTANECLPLVLLEAMQQGVPVISTHEGGIPDMVCNGENGLLVDQNNPEQLSAALKFLIENPTLRQAMGEKGRQIYLDNYTRQGYEQRIADILYRLTTN